MMNARELASKLGAKILTNAPDRNAEVKDVYICDLLSRVMSNAPKGSAWITVHTHINIVAVAALAELACIIIPEGIEVEDATIKKASEEGIVIMSSDLTGYRICCIIHDCGI